MMLDSGRPQEDTTFMSNRENKTNGPDLKGTSGNASVSGGVRDHGYDSELPDLEYSPFDWATVDVPSSPTLTRLSVALSIECAMPLLSLDDRDPEDSEYIPEPPNHEPFNRGNEEPNYDIYFPNLGVLGNNIEKISQTRIDCSWSPFSELYCFPDTSTTHLRKYAFPEKRPSSNLMEIVQKEEIRLRKNWCSLKRSLPLYDPTVIATMERLGDVYDNLCQHKKAEYFYRQVVSAIIKRHLVRY
jgi:hypothetical protein